MKFYNRYNILRKLVIIFMITSFAGFWVVAQEVDTAFINWEEGILVVHLNENGSLNTSSLKAPLKIFVGNWEAFDEIDIPSVMGQFEWNSNKGIFKPSFPFQKNQSYTLVLDNQLYYLNNEPKNSKRTTQIAAIYPSTAYLPANQLKIYLHFSAPMSEGRAYHYIHVLDEKGDTLVRPFLALQPELWDEERKRLTLWFDPGRVKRALGPNQYLGTPLQEGKKYQFIIDENWKDAEGIKLVNSFEKRFEAIKDDRKKPLTSSWEIQMPQAGTKDALSIDFKESLDHALAEKTIDVIKDESGLIKGTIELQKEESRWIFTPEDNWEEGSYQIKIAAYLEDLAGNNLNRLFDRDLSLGEEKAEEEFYYLEFKIY